MNKKKHAVVILIHKTPTKLLRRSLPALSSGGILFIIIATRFVVDFGRLPLQRGVEGRDECLRQPEREDELGTGHEELNS